MEIRVKINGQITNVDKCLDYTGIAVKKFIKKNKIELNKHEIFVKWINENKVDVSANEIKNIVTDTYMINSKEKILGEL